MRLRIKLQGEKVSFDVPSSCTLDQLKATLGPLLGCNDFAGLRVSLNGFNELTNGTSSISSLGVVTGDLIHILNNDNFMVDQGFKNEGAASVVVNRSDNAQSESVQSATAARQCAHSAGEGPSSHCVMFLEDGITDQLSEAYSMASCATEAFFAAVHVAALETGLQEKLLDSMEQSDKMPVSLWKQAPGFHQVTYNHPLCPGVTCSVSGSFVATHLMLGGAVNVEDPRAYQLSLKVSDYTSLSTRASIPAEPGMFYKNIKGLSQTVKLQLFNNLLDDMNTASGVAIGLLSLPRDIELRLMTFLDVVSLTRLARTCRYLNDCADDNILWKQLCHNDFRHSHADSNGGDIDWKEHYRRCWTKKRLASDERRYNEMYVDPPWPSAEHFDDGRFGSFTDIDPQFPGMLGGYHDLHPTLPYTPGGLHPMRGHAPLRQPRARFDPFGPLPEQHIRPRRPGRGPGGFGNPSRFL